MFYKLTRLKICLDYFLVPALVFHGNILVSLTFTAYHLSSCTRWPVILLTRNSR
jgi:hypothetical protein